MRKVSQGVLAVIVLLHIQCTQASSDKTEKNSADAKSAKSEKAQRQATAVQAGEAPATYKIECENYTLRGRVVSRQFYEEPGYGETPEIDAKRVIPILLVSSMKVVGCSPNDTLAFDKVTELQMDFPSPPKESLDGREVELSGFLFLPSTGHDHTDVLIMAEKFNVIK